jgi:type IX secretion system substrate protein
MKNKMLLFLLFAYQVTFSQSISKSVIGSTGQTFAAGGNKISWTVGESVVGLMTANGNQLGNGYHSSFNLQLLSVEDTSLEALVSVYPNPTSDYLNIRQKDNHKIDVKILDLNGKTAKEATLNSEEPFDISALPQGVYIMLVTDRETNKKNTYKIIKK